MKAFCGLLHRAVLFVYQLTKFLSLRIGLAEIVAEIDFTNPQKLDSKPNTFVI
jgi:hypothetical protein